MPDDSPITRPGGAPKLSPEATRDLSPELLALCEKEAQLHAALYADYKKIHDSAVSGAAISAGDYARVEAIFDSGMTQVKHDASDDIARTVEKNMRAEEAARGDSPIAKAKEENLPPELVAQIAQQREAALNPERKSRIRAAKEIFMATVETQLTQWKNEHSDVVRALTETAPLADAYKTHVVAHAPRENTATPPAEDTEAALIASLLRNNRGVAVGDFHFHQEATDFIARNMPAMKAAGVDTVYIECDQIFDRLDKSNASELKQLKAGLDATVARKNPDQRREESTHLEAQTAAMMGLFIAAKENGVRVVNIDKQVRVREAELLLGVEHRIASTNFTWVENIEADRKTQPESGKFVLFGGAGHFMSSGSIQGLADEGLGIPLIAYDNREKNAAPLIKKGDEPAGPDYQLPGGADYVLQDFLKSSGSEPETVKMKTEIIKLPINLPAAPAGGTSRGK